MSTILLSHRAQRFNHLTPTGHPERPDRLRAIEQVLEDEKFQALARVEFSRGPVEIITLCHPMEYVEAIREASPAEGLVRLDADTAMSPGSYEAALRAVGGAKLAVDEVVSGKAQNAFVATCPPGHHTETARPMAFLSPSTMPRSRALCAADTRSRTRRHRRLRRASWQRVAGYFLVGQERDVLLDP